MVVWIPDWKCFCFLSKNIWNPNPGKIVRILNDPVFEWLGPYLKALAWPFENWKIWNLIFKKSGFWMVGFQIPLYLTFCSASVPKLNQLFVFSEVTVPPRYPTETVTAFQLLILQPSLEDVEPCRLWMLPAPGDHCLERRMLRAEAEVAKEQQFRLPVCHDTIPNLDLTPGELSSSLQKL